MDEQLGATPEIQRSPDSTLPSSPPTKRYWAGGHDWSTGSQLQRFLANNEWQLGYSEQTGTPIAQRLIELFDHIKIGDEIAIKGCGGPRLRVRYIGRVQSIDASTRTLQLEPLTRSHYRGIRPVGEGAGNWTESLLEVKRPEDIALVFGTRTPMNFALNTILYGPPGTGKTFTVASQAVTIIDDKSFSNRQECMDRFEKLRELGQIGFVTFHQNFSYEEFIEGLRPVIDDAEEGGARYTVRNGILKEIALRALGACLQPTQPGRATFQDVWSAFVAQVESDPMWKLPGLSAGSSYKIEFTSRGNVVGTNEIGRAQEPYNASLTKIEKVFDILRDGPTATHKALMDILKVGTHTNLIGAVVEELKRLAHMTQGKGTQTEDQKQNAKSYLLNPVGFDLRSSQTPRYVLIVDEINRGNISKIFGELITLLEDDKRLGQTNALRVTLPYSGDTFVLPSNLYLLGTMNTADKSLALLDVALRRRFTFQEMRPNFTDSNICAGLTDAMRDVLRELNRRIMLVLDREHRIGHAFFISVKTGEEFNEVFEGKIVPLLQEYFYNDWTGLMSVLGEKENGTIVGTLGNSGDVKPRNRFAWWSDLDLQEPDFFKVLCQNYGISSAASNAPAPIVPTSTSNADTATTAPTA